MKKFISKNKNKKIIIFDVPLFMENKLNKKNDILIFVDSNKKEIYKRLKKRVNFSKKLIKKLKKTQFSLKFKKKHSDFIIKNNFKKNDLKKNVTNVLKNILLNA
jgi:dephospho-CoA kinase